jgi:hypothetical protein
VKCNIEFFSLKTKYTHPSQLFPAEEQSYWNFIFILYSVMGTTRVQREEKVDSLILYAFNLKPAAMLFRSFPGSVTNRDPFLFPYPFRHGDRHVPGKQALSGPPC